MLNATPLKRDRSIWSGISRKKFEERANTLALREHVPREALSRKKRLPKTKRQADVWELDTELLLCDSIAFLAAYDFGVRNVTVATVQATSDESGTGLTFRLAANSGVEEPVVHSLRNVFDLLESCAHKDLSRDQCAERIFDNVVKLSQNRILGRLGSKFFQKPHFRHGLPEGLLSKRLMDTISNKNVTTDMMQPRETYQSLRSGVELFHSACAHLEKSSGGDRIDSIKVVVKSAYDITIDGVSFVKQLREANFPQRVIDSRNVRQLSKVANYWRASLYLARMSRSYRHLFSKIRLETIEPYGPVQMLGCQKEAHVHAEIQMIVYYETSLYSTWPRAIGSSKEACFLCDSFVKAHGYFHELKSHRRVYQQWTVPDREDYNLETIGRLRQALESVAKILAHEVELSNGKKRFRLPYAAQSSINIFNPVFTTPSPTISLLGSVSTIQLPVPIGTSTEKKDALSADERLLKSNAAGPVKSSQAPHDESSANDLKDLSNPRPRESSHLSEDETHKNAAPEKNVVRDQSTVPIRPPLTPVHETPTFTSEYHTRRDWLSLHVELEALHQDQDTTIDLDRWPFANASVALETLSDSEMHSLDRKAIFIHVDKLAPGEETVIARSPPTVSNGNEDVVDCSLGLVLLKNNKSPIYVKCQWHQD